MKEKKQVLIADDEDFIRKLGTRILSLDGFEVLQAEDGEKAVEIYDKHKSNIILSILDINMPGRSGMGVFRHLTEQDPEARIALCSGYGDDVVPSGDHNNIFIQKPFSIESFRGTVQKILEMSGEEIRSNNERILNSDMAN